MTDVTQVEGTDVAPDVPRASLVLRQQAVVTDRGEVTVNVETGGELIVVEWFCGDDYSFKPDDLVQAISHIDSVGDIADVDLALRDSTGSPFAVRLKGGVLYVGIDDEASEDDCIPWKPLRKALRRAIKSAIREEEEE